MHLRTGFSDSRVLPDFLYPTACGNKKYLWTWGVIAMSQQYAALLKQSIDFVPQKKKKDRNDSSWGGTPETNGKEKLIFSGKFGDPTWNVSRELFAFAGLSNFSFHFLS